MMLLVELVERERCPQLVELLEYKDMDVSLTVKIYVPKNGHKMGDLARASAIWAIGKIQEASQDSSLAKQLAGRMLDQSKDDPEDPLVQFASAVALGWIKAPASISELKKVVDSPPAPIALARDWSLNQLSLARD